MRLKTLNGAPLPQHLDFTEASLVHVDSCEGFEYPKNVKSHGSSTLLLKWRSLHANGQRLRTGWSQPYLPHSYPNVERARTCSIPSGAVLPASGSHGDPFGADSTFTTAASMEDDFLEHSLIFHDTLLSSQVVDYAEDSLSDSFLTTSFDPTPSGMHTSDRPDENATVLQISEKATITPIGSLPNAQQLRSIYPQTPTPNFICVLMASPERREVYIRKSGNKMMLCELTVGDNTRSAFRVTIWLRPSQQSDATRDQETNRVNQMLEDIQVGDVLLLRNIALTSFRDTVYGQSLNPVIARARTSIDVLMNRYGVVVTQLSVLPPNVKDAFHRVKSWARMHVAINEQNEKKRTGPSPTGSGVNKRRRIRDDHDDDLPPDTLEAV